MLDIRVVVNYFGRPPKAFQLWLDSLGANLPVKWLFITDIDMACFRVPSNVVVLKSDFATLKKKLQSAFPYPVRYEKPWDFCAFKPVLGTVFADELAGADYWGWSDCDMLFGDLTPVLHLAEEGYDKIMPNGHFSLVKNSVELNKFILEHPKTYQALALSESGLSCFDERDFRFTVMHDFGAKQASEIVPYIHLYPRWGHFTFNVCFAACRELGIGKEESVPVIFTWCRGKLTGHFAMNDHTVKKLDLAYVHFFKRDIRAWTGELKNDGTVYLIEPGGIKMVNRSQDFSYRDVRWIDRARGINVKYFWDRLTWRTIKNKLYHKQQKSKDTLIYWPGC